MQRRSLVYSKSQLKTRTKNIKNRRKTVTITTNEGKVNSEGKYKEGKGIEECERNNVGGRDFKRI